MTRTIPIALFFFRLLYPPFVSSWIIFSPAFLYKPPPCGLLLVVVGGNGGGGDGDGCGAVGSLLLLCFAMISLHASLHLFCTYV